MEGSDDERLGVVSIHESLLSHSHSSHVDGLGSSTLLDEGPCPPALSPRNIEEQSNSGQLELTQDILERMREKATFYVRDNLTDYQKLVNDSAFKLVQEDQSYLFDRNRSRLYDDARKALRDAGYVFKRKRDESIERRPYYSEKARATMQQVVALSIQRGSMELASARANYEEFKQLGLEGLARIERMKANELEAALRQFNNEQKTLMRSAKRAADYRKKKEPAEMPEYDAAELASSAVQMAAAPPRTQQQFFGM